MATVQITTILKPNQPRVLTFDLKVKQRLIGEFKIGNMYTFTYYVASGATDPYLFAESR